MSLGPHVILQPWLLRQGYILYLQIFDEHTPGMSLVLAALSNLQDDYLLLAKSVLVALISLTTVLVWLAGRRMYGAAGGLIAAGIFMFWSPFFFTKLWHETFLGVLYMLMLVAYPLAPAAYSRRRFFLLGILSGCAVLFKQHALAVVGLTVAWHSFRAWRERRSARALLDDLSSWAAGGSLPLILFGVYYSQQTGNWEGLWDSLVRLRLEGNFIELGGLAPTAFQIQIVAWAFALLPLTLLRLRALHRDDAIMRQAYGAGFIILLGSALTVWPRFAFFHLQATMPLVALLSASALLPREASSLVRKWAPTGVALIILGLWLRFPSVVYGVVAEPAGTQSIDEYSNLVPLAAAIRREIGPHDCLQIYSDDEATANLYYLLGCTPSRFWVLHYPWLLLPFVRAKNLNALMEQPPAWIAYFPGRWNAETNAPELFAYIDRHYERTVQLATGPGPVWLLRLH